MNKKLISLFLTVILLMTAVLPSYAETDNEKPVVLTELFVKQELFRQYSLIYDTFHAAMMLEDGTEITGMGYTDYSAYYESEDGSVGYFPAGFIADFGYEIPQMDTANGYVIENLDFTDRQHQFVYGFETIPFMEHCVKDGKYLKYGVNDLGALVYEASPYERGVCDESLGALYSYDVNRFVYDPNMGEYIRIDGTSLFSQVDFAAAQAEINQIIANQDVHFSQQEIVSSVHIAQEAVVNYLLSVQKETFLGYNVAELAEVASRLDPMQCIRITPEGYLIIDIIDENPGTADELTRWMVGAGCLIITAGSIALDIFVPAARPLGGAIMGAAVEAFMQVVIQKKSLDNVQWGKVAVAAISGAVMAWACPMAAASVTKAAVYANAGELLSKIAGYGVLTTANGVVSGATNLALSMLDGQEAGWNVFLTGAVTGAAMTVGASLLSETITAVSPKITQVLMRTRTGNWAKKALDKAFTFVQEHQVHLKNESLEQILTPKSVHMAAKSALGEVNNHTNIKGGKFSDMTTAGDGSKQRHEMPSFSAYNNGKGIENTTRDALPAIKMDTEDHYLTASFGSSKAAKEYRQIQAALIAKGDMTSAIKMDIDDIHTLFGDKYDEAIKQALQYAIKEGWWNPWTENTGIFYLILESMNLSLEELVQ